MRIWAISDIHGHYKELMSLYDKMIKNGLNPETDVVVTLGDVVDGGPDTNKVISQLIEWKKQYPHWKFLRGNHCDLLFDAINPAHPKYCGYNMWFNQGGEATFNSYAVGLTKYEKQIANIRDIMPPEHWDFLYSTEIYYETENYFFVHAGVKPAPLEWCKKNMSADEMMWIRDEFIYSDYDWGKKIIFGHTINYQGRYQKGHLNPIVMDNKIGIDTMALNTGKLTAIMLPEEKFVFQKSLTK